MVKKSLVLSIILALHGAAQADSLILTFSDLNTKPQTKPGACSSVPWTLDGNFRMCDTSGGQLGGGLPFHKDAMKGGETWSFDNAGIMNSVTGTPGNPGTTSLGTASFPGSAAPAQNANPSWQQPADFFGQPFNFLAPVSGSLAGTAYNNATYIGGAPAIGNDIPFILAPVLEAQWGGTWFPLGQTLTRVDGIDNATGITFYADITDVAFAGGNTVTFKFEMYASECIDGAGNLSVGCSLNNGISEDPAPAGFKGWTAQWHMTGSGVYTDTTAPSLASTDPADQETGIPSGGTTYVVTYSEPMDEGTVDSTSISINGGATIGAPTASPNKKTFAFPISGLADGTTYTVTFKSGAGGPTDLVGFNLQPATARDFTVSVDVTNPTITAQSPPPDAMGVIKTTEIMVTFNEMMGAGTENAIEVKKTSNNAIVTGSVTTDLANKIYTFIPDSVLEDNTRYTVTVIASMAVDASGNPLTADESWSFTTEDIPPEVTLDTDTLTGCTINPRADFDPTLLTILFISFGWLAWRRKVR